jgi:hypothetical protein
MNNLYNKVAVASVCTALGFALGANKEAEAATFSYDYYLHPYSGNLTFQAIDGGSYGSFDGQGDTVTNVAYENGESIHPHGWNDPIERTDSREVVALLETPFSSITRYINTYWKNGKITSITNAVLQLYVSYRQHDNDSAVMGAFGYIGNGIPEASDFEAGVFLSSRNIKLTAGIWYDFNVTPFVKQIFSNNNEFAGFALRSLNQKQIVLPISEGIHSYAPKLIVSGELEGGVEPEPVPEPTTFFGSVIGLCLGGWLKRKKSIPHNKAKSQA